MANDTPPLDAPWFTRDQLLEAEALAARSPELLTDEHIKMFAAYDVHYAHEAVDRRHAARMKALEPAPVKPTRAFAAVATVAEQVEAVARTLLKVAQKGHARHDEHTRALELLEAADKIHRRELDVLAVEMRQLRDAVEARLAAVEHQAERAVPDLLSRETRHLTQ